MTGIAWIALAAAGGALDGIPVLENGRYKPFDTYVREFVYHVTGHVPAGAERPVEFLLDVARGKGDLREARVIPVRNEEVRAAAELDPKRELFSYGELAVVRDRIESYIEDLKYEGAADRRLRAAGKVLEALGWWDLVARHDLPLVPVPVGPFGRWVTLREVDLYLRGGGAPDVRESLEKFDRARLERVAAAWRGVLDRAAGAEEDLASALEALNPGIAIAPGGMERELLYNRLQPFARAAELFGIAFAAFLVAWIPWRRLRWLRGIGICAYSVAVAVAGYGFVVRWLIAQRPPMSNMYESMMVSGLALALIGVVFAVVMRDVLFLACGAALACAALACAERYFDPFVGTILPALQSVWMKIHVPTVMSAYAMAMVAAALGHVLLAAYALAPRAVAYRLHLERCVVVSLQVTALLLFAGIVLGAIWAGEAWGRPWGWDMKENWALVSLLAYAAILHLRMTGRLGGCALAVASIAGFGVILLTYFGVNLIFGRGLHTYGFGQGSMMPLILYGLVETAYVGIFLILGSLRNGREVPAPV